VRSVVYNTCINNNNNKKGLSAHRGNRKPRDNIHHSETISDTDLENLSRSS